jgi:hypothetical protein
VVVELKPVTVEVEPAASDFSGLFDPGSTTTGSTTGARVGVAALGGSVVERDVNGPISNGSNQSIPICSQAIDRSESANMPLPEREFEENDTGASRSLTMEQRSSQVVSGSKANGESMLKREKECGDGKENFCNTGAGGSKAIV